MRPLFITGFLRLLSLFSLPTLHQLGKAIGTLLYLLPNKAKVIATANILYCFPSKSAAEQERLIKATLIETGKTFTESSAFWHWPPSKLKPLIHETPSTALLKTAINNGKGAIILVPHIGAWEITGMYCTQLHPMTCLYRPPRMIELEPIIKQGRERMGLKPAPITQQGIRLLNRALKEHELIGILPDQDPGNNGGMFAPFFGKPANTMTLASRLAMKNDCPVFCVYAERLEKGRGFLIHCKPAPAEVSHATLEQSVAALNRMVEECATHLPTQYQWTYKRFKNQPPGFANIYKQKKR